MTDIFEEAKKDIEEEKFSHNLRKILPYLFVLICSIVVASAVYVWKKDVSKVDLNNLSTRYYRILEEEPNIKTDNNLIALQSIIDDSKNKYQLSGLAQLKKASILIQENKLNEALSVYKDIIKNRNNDITIKDMAILVSTSFKFSNNIDDDYIAELENISQDNRPWRFSALELMSVILIDQKKYDQAKEILIVLTSDMKVPSIIQNNAKMLLETIK